MYDAPYSPIKKSTGSATVSHSTPLNLTFEWWGELLTPPLTEQLDALDAETEMQLCCSSDVEQFGLGNFSLRSA
ncbi:hypothetical protein PF005_g27935 [Phytophthora fragariae]|uniref:Uncharacterized protein n=2 Tax=Phytophthora TaxID=4783 RepID=A0A6A4BN41_9STRA|nr:hypothetical protein PF003_g3113 [Phytophthora fragariae]KAE9014999.1 hypothetical protein PR002_g14066 [Phytophthora rubi]KAE8922092.1 hypothetical protein PF009_g27638 [Phytophthora fragariae]KAE8971033.1 hypothetical protein PF011_g26189 [Phytophthora fragariae]KAE9020113.1 hypothetical protein PR001_g13691 [Phytophthora rubi]